MRWRLARACRSPPALGLRVQRLARPQMAPSRSWDPIRVLMTLKLRVAVAVLQLVLARVAERQDEAGQFALSRQPSRQTDAV